MAQRRAANVVASFLEQAVQQISLLKLFALKSTEAEHYYSLTRVDCAFGKQRVGALSTIQQDMHPRSTMT